MMMTAVCLLRVDDYEIKAGSLTGILILAVISGMLLSFFSTNT